MSSLLNIFYFSIFGAALLLSEQATERRTAAERGAEEVKLNKTVEDGGEMTWNLSDRERAIVRSLGQGTGADWTEPDETAAEG